MSRWLIRTPDGLDWYGSREEAEASLLDWYTTVLHETEVAPDDSGDLLLVVGSTEEVVGATSDEDSERGKWLRDRGLDYEVTGYRLKAALTPADLRALLRARPEAALEALADVRIAGPWEEVPMVDRWVRAPWRGYIWRDPTTGKCRVWDSEHGYLVGAYPTLAEAKAAADAYLRAEGWVLVGGAE